VTPRRVDRAAFLAAFLSFAGCSPPSAVSSLGGDPAPLSLRGCWRVEPAAEKGKVEGYRVPHVVAAGTIYCFDEEQYAVLTANGYRNAVGARWHRHRGNWQSMEMSRYWLALDRLMKKIDEDIHPDERCALDPRACKETDDYFQSGPLEIDVDRGRLRLHHKHTNVLDWVPIVRLTGDAESEALARMQSLPSLAEVQREEAACFRDIFARQDCVSWPDKETCGGLATCRSNVRMHLPTDPPCKLDPPSEHCERVMSLTNALLPSPRTRATRGPR
jgi:hypothetical protein